MTKKNDPAMESLQPLDCNLYLYKVAGPFCAFFVTGVCEYHDLCMVGGVFMLMGTRVRCYSTKKKLEKGPGLAAWTPESLLQWAPEMGQILQKKKSRKIQNQFLWIFMGNCVQ